MKSIMKRYGKYFLALCIIVSLIAVSACTTASPTLTTGVRSPTAAATQTVMDVLKADNNFSTLVTALEIAGLDENLAGPGGVTLFAPTNAAFSNLPSGTVGALLADASLLKSVLAYHVVPGNLTAAQIGTMSELRTMEGTPLKVNKPGAIISINSAQVIEADMMASNGIVHTIDTLLIPISLPTSPSPSPGTAPNEPAGEG